jgi:hypothetical protein
LLKTKPTFSVLWLGFEDQIEYGAVTFAEEGYIGPEHHLVEEPGT